MKCTSDFGVTGDVVHRSPEGVTMSETNTGSLRWAGTVGRTSRAGKGVSVGLRTGTAGRGDGGVGTRASSVSAPCGKCVAFIHGGRGRERSQMSRGTRDGFSALTVVPGRDSVLAFPSSAASPRASGRLTTEDGITASFGGGGLGSAVTGRVDGRNAWLSTRSGIRANGRSQAGRVVRHPSAPPTPARTA